jgi:hypothetical protein
VTLDWTEALERRIERTKHERYRQLCDAGHPEHLAWRRKLVAEESGEASPAAIAAAPVPCDEARPAVQQVMRWIRDMKKCPYRSKEGCGCWEGRCALRGGAMVGHPDCFQCLERYG